MVCYCHSVAGCGGWWSDASKGKGGLAREVPRCFGLNGGGAVSGSEIERWDLEKWRGWRGYRCVGGRQNSAGRCNGKRERIVFCFLIFLQGNKFSL